MTPPSEPVLSLYGTTSRVLWQWRAWPFLFSYKSKKICGSSRSQPALFAHLGSESRLDGAFALCRDKVRRLCGAGISPDKYGAVFKNIVSFAADGRAFFGD
jgi:hypothetical protein